MPQETIDFRTNENKHRKVTFPCPWNPKIGKITYYIANLPEGRFLIHSHMPWYQQGYSGQTLEFLMEDGSIEKVKGPFYEWVWNHDYIFKNIKNYLK